MVRAGCLGFIEHKGTEPLYRNSLTVQAVNITVLRPSEGSWALFMTQCLTGLEPINEHSRKPRLRTRSLHGESGLDIGGFRSIARQLQATLVCDEIPKG